ncbi:MAG: porin, partial [Candidatus Hydrogenedentota bacterium]
NKGVVTLEGAAYRYDLNDEPDPDLRDGDALIGLAGYLIPKEVGYGKFQPHVRYQEFEDDSQYDLGVNYVINGHNARVSLVYSLIKDDGTSDSSQIVLGTQFQF